MYVCVYVCVCMCVYVCVCVCACMLFRVRLAIIVAYHQKRQRLVNSVGLSVNERHNSPLSVSSSCRFQQCNRTLQAPGRQSAARDTSPPQLRDINSWLSRNTTNSSRSSRPSNRFTRCLQTLFVHCIVVFVIVL